MPPWAERFEDIWAVDFEFIARPGCRPEPVCMVARGLKSRRLVRLWQEDLLACSNPPYPTGPNVLFVAYLASAELGCHAALGWPMPARILDLYAEFRCRTAGIGSPHGFSLLGAMLAHGLPAIDAAEKENLRELVMRGGPWTAEERRALIDYCQSDVDALARLLPAMGTDLDLPRALLRGRYMAAVARMERNGVPVDVVQLARLREHWDGISGSLIKDVDAEYGVFDGTTFKADRWADYLARQGIPWPTLESGALALDDDTFREQARIWPAEVGPVRELRHALGQLRLNELAVGPDGRNRVLLSPFASKTGRNQPSNSKFVFGPSCWLRSLIRPEEGSALAYIDWSQQELAIAAALSGDPRMIEAYESGDFYLTFAKMAGAVPADATKKSHAAVRDQFKTASLGVLYGLSDFGLARKLGVPQCRARELLEMHRRVFRRFWMWSHDAVADAMLTLWQQTVFGWTCRVGPDANPRSLRNFHCQANGAEMMRVACCLATEDSIRVCCPVHDALLVEGPAADIDDIVTRTQEHMRRAAAAVLGGFTLRSDAKVIRSPDRYSDERGRHMWDIVQRLLP